MTRTFFHGGLLLDPEAAAPVPDALLVADGRIAARLPADAPPPDGARVVALGGRLLAPGYLDLHYHGRLIFERAEDAPRALAEAAARLLRGGVTGFLPTTVAWPRATLHAQASAWAQACDAIASRAGRVSHAGDTGHADAGHAAANHASRAGAAAGHADRASYASHAGADDGGHVGHAAVGHADAADRAVTAAAGHANYASHAGHAGAVTAAGGRALATPLGLHLEGPWISAAAAGAQPPGAIRAFDAAEFDALLARTGGWLRMVTLAPEAPGAQALLAALARAGVRAALGHSHASAADAEAAIGAGASHITHLFNAMGALHHRAPGLAGVALTDPRVSCDLICDGVHVHPALVRLATRAKGEQLALITDRVEPPLTMTHPAHKNDAHANGADKNDARAAFGPVSEREGALRLADGRLAGSALTLDRARPQRHRLRRPHAQRRRGRRHADPGAHPRPRSRARHPPPRRPCRPPRPHPHRRSHPNLARRRSGAGRLRMSTKNGTLRSELERKRVPLIFFHTETGREPVRDWLKQKMSRIDLRAIGEGLKLLELGWPVGMPLCRPLGQGLFELRVSLRGNRQARVLLCFFGARLWALHGFLKKQQKTPPAELKHAASRRRQVEATSTRRTP